MLTDVGGYPMSMLLVGIDLDRELELKLREFFEDYVYLPLSSEQPDQYYEEARKMEKLLAFYKTVFVLVGNKPSALPVIVAAKLARQLKHFHVAEWTGERFRALRVP